MPTHPATNTHSFIDLLTRYSDAHAPVMRYPPGADLESWQREFHARLEELRGPVPERAPLEVKTELSEATPTHTRHLLAITVNEFSTLPAWLLVPNNLRQDEKRPGIIALHGHTDRGMHTIAGVGELTDEERQIRAYGLQAVESGFVVMAPAWWGWPGRDGHIGRVGTRDKCNVIQMAASMYGLSILGLHIQDGQAALDVLAARPEVDGSRIGCIGNSYGGRTAMWLSAFDRRIRATVASGCMNTFRERSLKLSSCALQYFPGLLRYGDVAEVFSLIAPRPLQLMAGTADGLLNNNDREAIHKTVSAAYVAANAADNLDYAVHPGGHWLEWSLAEKFLREYLM